MLASVPSYEGPLMGASPGSVGKGSHLSNLVMTWVTSDQPFHSSGPVCSPTTLLKSLPRSACWAESPP